MGDRTGGTVVTDAMPADHRWHLGVSVAPQDVTGWNLWDGHNSVAPWRDDAVRAWGDATTQWIRGAAAQ